MTVLKKLRQNLFLFAVALTYLTLFLLKPGLGIGAVKTSGYYIKEMLIIMPAILVMTALLDLWIPKEKILQFLGKDAGARGLLLSFAVGSLSAGPIYAAFPMCVMLHKKGASIRNIIVILSSWAVIKLPMLLNEAKFLGLRFMAIRWALTVIAILIFSRIGARFIKDGDLPGETRPQSGLRLNRGACIGCALCVKNAPALFEMHGKKAAVKPGPPEAPDMQAVQAAIDSCPVHAIEYSRAPHEAPDAPQAP